ncbi:MAG: hypothetical protein JST00_04610 [Deltaproteobacteria bacterium]|nr:hypothetical protein [Deltaproteobacteria bacterium]
MKRRVAFVIGGVVACGLLALTTLPSAAAPAAPASAPAPRVEAPPPTPAAERPTIVSGAPYRKTIGPLTISIPADLAVLGGKVDLLVHFHGIPKCQENNLVESGLGAVVVSVNEGEGSIAYKRYAEPGTLDRLVSFAKRELAASRRLPSSGVEIGRIALSSWSAGGAATQSILARESARIDAVIVADGIFSTYTDRRRHAIDPRPLAPIVDYARRAASGEKLFLLTHTDIIPNDYPNVDECARHVLSALGLAKGPPPSSSPSGVGAPLYGVSRGDLQITGFKGRRAPDHAAQLYALDDAYRKLRQRWGH